LTDNSGRRLGEFDLIRRYFAAPESSRGDTLLGVGDDCALLRPSAGFDLAVTTDTLVSGVHFFADVDPADLGHKALAVNLSDLAAMGAAPAWVTLCLTLPSVNEAWVERFRGGFLALAQRHSVDLVGGDTTRGPLSITVQAIGFVTRDHALRRSTARAGDLIYVTGTIGSAGLGLKVLRGEAETEDREPLQRLLRPEPRVEAAQALVGLAHACIDVSDGLAADLGHILDQSGFGATLDADQLPLSSAVMRYIDNTGDWSLPLTAGDDYELCFTAPAERSAAVDALFERLKTPCTLIGRVEADPGLRIHRGGRCEVLPLAGYDHFRAA
jgi:thiamine-monophosphate kinase